MVYLQATQKARLALGVGTLDFAEPGKTDSKLGNWLVNVVPIGDRYAFLFMSVPCLLSFPIFIGRKEPGPQDMPNFLAHGVDLLLKTLKTPKRQVALLLSDFDEVALCKATSKSQLGIQAGIAADYFYHADRASAKVDIDVILHEVNSTPRAPLDWRTPFEVAKELLAQ